MPEEKVAAPDGVAEANKAVTTKPAATRPAVGKALAAKPSKLEETKAKNKQALADALAKAQAVKIEPAPKAPPAATAKAGKPAKLRKIKLVRHRVTMPEAEYEQIAVLKKRIASLGGDVKRSELMRGGLALLAALGDTELAFVMAPYGHLKTRRRAKKA